MSSALALLAGKAIARKGARKRAPILIRQIGQDVAASPMEPTGAVVLSSGLIGVGAIAVVVLFGVGIYLEYLRFKAGTKWERITQIGAVVVRLVGVPLELGGAPAPVVALAKVLGSGLDGYAAGHQIARGPHPIANGVSLVGDAYELADAIALLARGYGLGMTPTDSRLLPQAPSGQA